MRAGDVARPDGRGQAVTAVVGNAQRLVEVAKADGREHRTEDLLTRDAHLRLHAVEYRGLDVAAAAALAHALTAERHARTLAAPRRDVVHHAMRLRFIHHRTQHGVRVERIR